MNDPVEQVIVIDYSPEMRQTVLEGLNRYGDKDFHREQERVKLAALRIAEGDLARLEEMISAARSDYRDVLAWAEEPNLFRCYGSKDQRKLADARQEDRRQ